MAVFHKDLTGLNLHVPLGYSPDALTMIAATDAMEWLDDNSKNLLLINTTADAVTLGDATARYDWTLNAKTLTITFTDDATNRLLVQDDSGNTFIDLDTGNGAGGRGALAFGDAGFSTNFSWLGAGHWVVGGSIGNSGDVLTSNGTGFAPTWQAAAAAAGGGTNNLTWTVNDDSVAGTDEDACLILESADGTNEFDLKLCWVASAGVITGHDAYAQLDGLKNGAEHGLELHLSARGDVTSRKTSLFWNSGTGALAKSFNITLETTGAVEFNQASSYSFSNATKVQSGNFEVVTGSMKIGGTTPTRRFDIVDTAADNNPLALIHKNAGQDATVHLKTNTHDWAFGIDYSGQGFAVANAGDLTSAWRFGITSSGLIRFSSEGVNVLSETATPTGNMQTQTTDIAGATLGTTVWSHTLTNREGLTCLLFVSISSTTDSGSVLIACGARTDDGVTATEVSGGEAALYSQLDAQLLSDGVALTVDVSGADVRLRAVQDSGTYQYSVMAIWVDGVQ